LSRVVQKYQEFDLRDKKKNDELSEDYRRITKQYKDLQAKFRHFELADNRKFEEIWSMHEEEVDLYVKQALKADRIINEQQLGWKWRSPDLDIVRNPSLMNEEEGEVESTVAANNTTTTHRKNKYTIEEVEEQQKQQQEETEAGKTHVSSDKLRSVISLISEEAGFLVEDGVRKAIDSLGGEGESQGGGSSLEEAESLLRSLGVTSEDDVVALTNYFFIEVVPDKSLSETLNEEDNDDNENEALERLQKLIQPDGVIKAIQKFVKDKKDSAMNGKKRGGGGKVEKEGEGDGEGGEGKGKKPNEEMEFWKRMSSVVNFQPWVQLEKSLLDYNEVLVQRARGIESVSSLGSQNQNLKELLNQYLGSQINDELIVPPTETIKLGASNAAM